MHYIEYKTSSETQDLDGFILTLQQLFNNNQSTLEITVESDSLAENFKICYQQDNNASVDFILNIYAFDNFLEEISTSDLLTDNYLIRFTGLIENELIQVIRKCITETSKKSVASPLIRCSEGLFVTKLNTKTKAEKSNMQIYYDLTRYSTIYLSKIAFEQYLQNHHEQIYQLDALDDITLLLNDRRRIIINDYSEYYDEDELLKSLKSYIPDLKMGPIRAIVNAQEVL